MRRIRPRALCLAAAVLALAAAPVAAQDVQYKTVSKMDLGGVINALARLGGGLEVEQTTYIKGSKMRTDVDKTSTIMDFATGSYIWIDHEAKTYSVVTLAQMLAQMEQGLAQAKASQANAGAPQVTSTGDNATTIHTDSGDVHLEFDLDVERTNETERVNGWNARRSILTMKTDATVETETEGEQEAGSLIVVVDLWSSTDVPVHDATRRLYESAAGAQYMEEAGNAAQSVGAAFAGDPNMSAALQQAGEEMQKIEGHAVKTTTYLVALAPGKEFDRSLVLEPQPKESAARRIGGGMLRGALGRAGARQQEEQEEEAPSQKTVMSFISETRDAKAGNLADSLFEPPAGYRQVEHGTGG